MVIVQMNRAPTEHCEGHEYPGLDASRLRCLFMVHSKTNPKTGGMQEVISMSKATGIEMSHSCHPKCERPLKHKGNCVSYRKREILNAKILLSAASADTEPLCFELSTNDLSGRL